MHTWHHFLKIQFTFINVFTVVIVILVLQECDQIEKNKFLSILFPVNTDFLDLSSLSM